MQEGLLKPSSLEVYCDFDGTATDGDVIDLLLERTADPAWREVESQWEEGQISSRECMARQVQLIRGGWAAVAKALDSLRLEPTFAPFASWCASLGIPLHIASDGVDRVIDYMLDRENVSVASRQSNHLVESADGSFKLEFPSTKDNCLFGYCKCALLEKAQSGKVKVIIGDGASDYCWADQGDLLFAKAKLLKHCRQEGIPHIEYDNFDSIRRVLEKKMNLASSCVCS